VRTAAAAIATIYAAVLGLAFSANKPLPPRGLVPAIFLGLAIVLATVYTAFPLRQKPKRKYPVESPSPEAYTATFIWWITDRVFHKAFALRAAVISLGFGVLFLPSAFLSLGAPIATTPALPAWPPPPNVQSTELQQILYKAQVDEAAAQRQAKLDATPTESAPGLYAAAIVCLALVFAIPGFLGFVDRRRDREPQALRTVQPPAHTQIERPTDPPPV
jgi:hypothetical protein